MKLKKTLPIVLMATTLAACSSNKELTLLHDDDIYYSPDRPEDITRFEDADNTVMSNAFIDDATAKVDTSVVRNNYYNDNYEYYNPSVSENVLSDTSAVARYYNTAYNTPQYYNYDRFRFNVGIGYSSFPYSSGLYYGNAGWNGSFGYGYSPFGYPNYGYSPYGYSGYGYSPYSAFGWNPYGGYGGNGYGNYYCPNPYNSNYYYPGGNFASNSYFGHRPSVGGNTGNGGTTETNGTYVRTNVERGAPNSRQNYMATRTAAPQEAKQPVYYSAQQVRNTNSRTARTTSNSRNSGFMNFIRESGRSTNTNGSGRHSTGSRSGNSYRSSGSRSSGSAPSRSYSTPRSSGGGGMRR